MDSRSVVRDSRRGAALDRHSVRHTEFKPVRLWGNVRAIAITPPCGSWARRLLSKDRALGVKRISAACRAQCRVFFRDAQMATMRLGYFGWVWLSRLKRRARAVPRRQGSFEPGYLRPLVRWVVAPWVVIALVIWLV